MTMKTNSDRIAACALLTAGRIIPLVLLCALAGVVRGTVPPPPGTPPSGLLAAWSFNDTNAWVSDAGSAPIGFTGLSGCALGDGTALVVDSPNPALLRYNVTEANGTTNLCLGTGTVMVWVAPQDWSGTNAGGSGPGQWGRLVEVGAYTTNASFGWWSLYTDPAGCTLFFSAQTNNGG